MSKTQIRVKSWNRFLTRYLAVKPDIMGKHHAFLLEDATVTISLPSVNEVDRGRGFDVVAEVGARRTADNEPLEYHINKVDVEVELSKTVDIPTEMLDRNLSAYELLSEEEQEHLNNMAWQHELIAEKAFEY